MKKRSLGFALVISMLISLFTAFQITAGAATSGIYTYTVSGEKATITDCIWDISGAIEIPATLGGYPVTSIGDFALSWCENLTSITIPDSVTSIGDDVFYWCASLIKIIIPDSVISIGNRVFENCSSLTDVYYSGTKQEWENISIGSSNSFLANVNIHYNAGVATSGIYTYLFSDGKATITDCNRYASGAIEIPETLDGYLVTAIGDFAFDDCTNLTSITIPDGVTSIGKHAFSWCESLTSITLPDGVTSIGNAAFAQCISLTSIIIPNGVTSIGDEAFSNCYNLTSIIIPNSITSLGNGAFRECALTDVHYTGTKQEWIKISIGSGNSPLANANIHYNPVVITSFTIEKFENYTKIDISVINAPSEATLFVAAYNNQKKRTEIKTPVIKNGKAETKFSNSDAILYKAFVWKEGIQPLALQGIAEV